VHDGGTLLSELLSAAPGLRLLVTSRSPVRAYGEQELPVRPMAVPQPGADPETIAASEAVELFVQRAGAVLPGFALTPVSASAIADIVARIDGLPLAIELAASRVRLLSPHELAERLGSRLRLLTGGASGLPDRQRTLRATIDWSYQLLDADEQTLFRRLSCFVGGCTIESAAAVADPAEDLAFDVLDGIASLMDKSLLWRQEGVAGASRFRMLETLREYAREQLDTHDETGDVRRRHTSHLHSGSVAAGARAARSGTPHRSGTDTARGRVRRALRRRRRSGARRRPRRPAGEPAERDTLRPLEARSRRVGGIATEPPAARPLRYAP
jgi:predicted ATPase